MRDYLWYRAHLSLKRSGVAALRTILRAGVRCHPAPPLAKVTGTVVLLDRCLGLGDALMLSPLLPLLAPLGPVTVVTALPPLLEWPGAWLTCRNWGEMTVAVTRLAAEGRALFVPRLGVRGLLTALTWPGGLPAGTIGLDDGTWLDTTGARYGNPATASRSRLHYTDSALSGAHAMLRGMGREPHPPYFGRVAPRRAASDTLARLGLPEDQPIVALAPWATSRIRRWPLEHWSQLILRLATARPDLGFVLLGSPEERRFGDEIIAAIHACDATITNTVYNRMGQASLAETTAVIAGAATLVACDNGLMHLGLGVGTPLVAVFGSTDPALRLCGQAWRLAYDPGLCPHGRAPCYPDLHRDPSCPGAIACLRDLPVQRVATLTLELLGAIRT